MVLREHAISQSKKPEIYAHWHLSSIVGGFRSGFSGRRKDGGGAEEGRRIIKNSGRWKGGGGAEEGRNH